MSGAWLYWVGAPHSAVLSGLNDDGGIELDPSRRTVIGRVPESDIGVRTPQIGGRRNSQLQFRDGAWHYEHLGHSLPIFHDEHVITGSGDPRSMVAHGDVFGPITVAGDRISFLFLANNGRLRADVFPAIENAVTIYFPDRAEALLAEVRQWFPSEALAGAAGLAHVLHCGLCGGFRRRDRVVHVEAFRPGAAPIRFQVLADSESRIGSGTHPSMGLCEKCLADPDQTFRSADDADRLRADLHRALVAADPESRDAIVRELDRRFAFAQPRRSLGPCSLCGRGEVALSERTLEGCSGTICRACLHGASAVRHVRG